MALEHSREELRTQKVETSAAQSRYKQLALQVEIQNERDATKRAEERLRGTKYYMCTVLHTSSCTFFLFYCNVVIFANGTHMFRDGIYP